MKKTWSVWCVPLFSFFATTYPLPHVMVAGAHWISKSRPYTVTQNVNFCHEAIWCVMSMMKSYLWTVVYQARSVLEEKTEETQPGDTKLQIGGCFVICQSLDRGATVPQQTGDVACALMVDVMCFWQSFWPRSHCTAASQQSSESLRGGKVSSTTATQFGEASREILVTWSHVGRTSVYN